MRQNVNTDKVMLNVVYALLPLVAFSVYAFGTSAILLVVVSTLSCILTEHLICKFNGKSSTVGDWSAAVTGILLALTLPPGFPLWMAAVGGFISIVLGKTIFGGLGFNVFNPALVGRAFLQAAFPIAITTWTPALGINRFASCVPTTLALPFMQPNNEGIAGYISAAKVDGFSGATPLSLMKFSKTPTEAMELFAGMTAGSAGETCAILILLCGIYLAARKMLDWRIPVGMIGSVAVFSAIFWVLNKDAYPNPLFMLFSGGLMLGAVFMATDMVTSPVTPVGVWIYSILLGFLTVIIRLKGGLPEGVMYAILLGNAITPIINELTQPKIFGAVKVKEAK